MESLSRPPHRRKHSTASSSSFSRNNPYGDVMLSRGDKAKFQPHEYAEIFSGSSSIPVLDLSGLKGPGGCRSSELDYSNIFGGAKDADVAVSHEQLFNGVVKKNKTRIREDAASPFQENGSLSSSGKAKSSLGANGLPVDGISQQFNMSYNKTSQRSSSESNGKTHIAQFQAVPGFTHFVDHGTPQLQKKEGGRPVLLGKREVSRTWSFSTGLDATTVKGGLSSEKSHTPDKSCLPSFASKETAGENSPPLFDEELDENSDAAVSIAALKKAIEQAQESMRLAKMIMQKKREGIKDGSRARRSKGRPKVEDKKENTTEHEYGGPKENNVTGKNQQLDPTFQVFTRVDGKSAPILSHSDNLLSARRDNLETVRENFESANDHGDVFFEVDEKFGPSCSQSSSINTEEKDGMNNIKQNVGASEPHGETTSFTGSVETVVLESGKLDCNDNLCSTTKAVPCLDHMETDQETLEHGESTMHQKERPEVFHRGAESAANTSRSVLELEQSPNEEAVEQFQATVSPEKGPPNLVEQLERVLVVSGRTPEQEKIIHGGGHLRISQENEPPEVIGRTADKEKHEMKFVGHGELYLSEHLTVPRSDFNTLHNELLDLAEKNMVDEADNGQQPENVCEWKEDGQDAKCSDEGERGMVSKEEIIWFESELQLEEKLSEGESEPGIFPVVGEAASKVDMVLKPEIGDEKLNFELEEDSQTEHGEHEENEIAVRCMDAAQGKAIETIQIGTNSDSEVQNGRIPLDVEDLNHTDGAAGRRKNLQDNDQELNDSTSEKDTSEAISVHSNDPGIVFSDNDSVNTTTFFSEIPEPCNVDFKNEAGECQTVLRGCEENCSLPQETETFLAVEDNDAGKQFELELNNMPGTDSFCRSASAEKFTVHQFHQLKNILKGFSSDRKSTSVVLTNADHEKTPPNNADMFKTAIEIHNTAQRYAAGFPKLQVSTDNQVEKIDNTNVTDLRQNAENKEESQSTSNIEIVDEVSAQESPACRDDAEDISSNKEEVKGDLDMKSDETVDAGQRNEFLNSEDQSHLSQTNCKPKEMDKSVEAERDIKTGQDMEENVQNLGRTSTSEKQNAEGIEQKCEIDSWQRIEAIRRGREREKDRIAVEREREKARIAVERAIREVRERAFAEARERAERAAVERAAAEAQQRVRGEVREKTVKASVETKPSVHKVSTEAKLRVERAAVERATAEARERALEKAMSQKNSNGARVQAAKYSAETSSSSSRNNGLKHNSSYSDLETSDGTNSESAQRRKARLERHQRIMERAAKALAEKNTRDLLAQKEQAERSRLAESLDADIKRWATGKEGNLRALLSTLQYILGPASAWQPVSLTEIVTAAAVKKTYRKATLCVHPDKLQQRGASIQQKYICEKIFDLLKAAWNRFNSEEN